MLELLEGNSANADASLLHYYYYEYKCFHKTR